MADDEPNNPKTPLMDTIHGPSTDEHNDVDLETKIPSSEDSEIQSTDQTHEMKGIDIEDVRTTDDSAILATEMDNDNVKEISDVGGATDSEVIEIKKTETVECDEPVSNDTGQETAPPSDKIASQDDAEKSLDGEERDVTDIVKNIDDHIADAGNCDSEKIEDEPMEVQEDSSVREEMISDHKEETILDGEEDTILKEKESIPDESAANPDDMSSKPDNEDVESNPAQQEESQVSPPSGPPEKQIIDDLANTEAEPSKTLSEDVAMETTADITSETEESKDSADVPMETSSAETNMENESVKENDKPIAEITTNKVENVDSSSSVKDNDELSKSKSNVADKVENVNSSSLDNDNDDGAVEIIDGPESPKKAPIEPIEILDSSPKREVDYESETVEKDGNKQKDQEGTNVIKKERESETKTDSSKVVESSGAESKKPEASEKPLIPTTRIKQEASDVTSQTQSTNKKDNVIEEKATKTTTDTKPVLPPTGGDVKPPVAVKPTPKHLQKCIVCNKVGKCKYNIVRNGDIKHLCDDKCFSVFRSSPTSYLRSDKNNKPADTVQTNSKPSTPSTPEKSNINSMPSSSAIKTSSSPVVNRKCCANCGKSVIGNQDSFLAPIGRTNDFKDFCNQVCLQKFEQNSPPDDGDDDIEIVGVSKVRPRTRLSTGHATCAVCGKMAGVKHEVNFDSKTHKLCSDPCFAAFRYANKLTMNTCENCGVYCFGPGMRPHYIQFEGQQKRFCSVKCVDTFKETKSKMVPCAWCSTKKSNFDMIERVDANNKYQLFCSLNCLSLYRVNLQATSNQSVICDHCKKTAPAQYHLTMSDASVRNFCCYTCVMAFQSQYTGQSGQQNSQASGKTAPSSQPTQNKSVVNATSLSANTSTRPTRAAAGQAKQQISQIAAQLNGTDQTGSSIPIISNVMSLASPGNAATTPQTPPAAIKTIKVKTPQNSVTSPTNQIKTTMVSTETSTEAKQVIVQPPPPKQVKNKALLCKPFFQTKATSCRPHTQTISTQTDKEEAAKPVLIPVPIPFFVPMPMQMYTSPTPYPMPIPIPIPIPCFVPTTKKSADGILKHIKEIQERIPADPFEAELLMMAEAVANAEKSGDDSDKSDDEDNTAVTKDDDAPASTETTDTAAPNAAATSAAESASMPPVLGEDMLQMALRMATEMTEPVMDLEDSLQPAAINTENNNNLVMW